MAPTRKRLAVLGQPVAHSLSPLMHTAAFAAVGLGDEWSYEAIELPPAEFEAGVGRLVEQGWVGANVTIPHKQAALAIADEATIAAREIGAANTLSFSAGRIAADNTDAPGLIAALPTPPRGLHALVLGAGGAGRAAAWALRGEGAQVSVWNRTTSRAAALAEELGVDVVPEGTDPPFERADLIVNATAVGLGEPDRAAGDPDRGFKRFGLGADKLSDRQVVVDLVYGTAETELVTAARECSATVIDGREILVRQGAASFSIWTGLEAPLAAMRRALWPRDDEPRER